MTTSLIYDGSDNLVSKTVTAYDSFSPLYAAANAIRHDPAFGQNYLTRGLPTTISRWYDIAGNLSLTTSARYDECGNVRKVIDANSHSTYTEYWLSAADNAYAFPLRVTNAKNHVAQATYSYKAGVPLTITDANTVVSTMTYDSLDRVTQTLRSDGAKKTITYVGIPTPPYALVRTYLTASTYIETRADLDDMGKLKEVTAPGNI